MSITRRVPIRSAGAGGASRRCEATSLCTAAHASAAVGPQERVPGPQKILEMPASDFARPGDLSAEPSVGGRHHIFASAAFTDRWGADQHARPWALVDNVFVERLWRGLTNEEVHLKAYANGLEARIGIGQWLRFYNDSRPHQALGYKTPAAVWAAEGCPVDLPQRLDDAGASPTTPQGHQPQNMVQI